MLPHLISNIKGTFLWENPAALLHNAHIITKCRNRYYKMRNILQNASLLQNAAEHAPLIFAPPKRKGTSASVLRDFELTYCRRKL